jgi:hypothetical protein
MARWIAMDSKNAMSRLTSAPFAAGSQFRCGYRTAVALLALFAAVAPLRAAAEAEGRADIEGARAPALIGSVSGERAPLSAASVFAYRLADLSLRKVFTNAEGEFAFSALPAGLYKIIAHKPGFVPAVVLLTRATAASFQELELELAPMAESGDPEAADFWTIRERIPSDVLREITFSVGDQEAMLAEVGMEQRIHAEMRALSGRDTLLVGADAQVTGGALDLRSEMGRIAWDLRSDFHRLEPVSQALVANVEGETSSLAFSLDPNSSSSVEVTSHQGELLLGERPIDYERYGVSWSADVGGGHSSVEAHYLEESNFYADTRMERFHSFAIPDASRTWQVSGSYQRELTSSSGLRTGVTYRERSGESLASAVALPSQERIDLFGLSHLELHRVLGLELGVFGNWLDGTFAVAPHIGLSFDLNEHWSAKVAARRQFEQARESDLVDFIPLYYRRALDCTPAEANCYRLSLTRRSSDDNSVSVGLVQREYTDTLRLYFSDEFFDQLQSLFLVAGDEIPELQLAMERRLSPQVMARFESSYGRGGGGVVELVPAALLQNEVEFLIGSLETRFEATDTGVELAYMSMAQVLGPRAGGSSAVSLAPLDLDRLRLFISQDLRRLLGLASDWALLLDMELSRGGDPAMVESADELRRRVVGGVAVRF